MNNSSSTKTDISFIIVNWNTCGLVTDCINSIIETVTGYSYEIFVVDNASSDGSPERLKKTFGDRVTLIENKTNQGFGRANNQALRIADSNYMVLLNSDTVLHKNTISGIISFLEENPSVAIAGPRMKSEYGRLQNSYDNFPSLLTELFNKSILRKLFPERFSGKTDKTTTPFEVDSLIGACMAVRADAIKQVGLFDEDYFFFLEETDWCLRMRKAGWKIFHLPGIEIIHLQGQSKKLRPALAWIEYYRSLYIFFRKHRSTTSYILLRVFRFLKLNLNLVLTFAGLCITLGRNQRYRRKLPVYAHILWWHLKGCPANTGLADSKNNPSQTLCNN